MCLTKLWALMLSKAPVIEVANLTWKLGSLGMEMCCSSQLVASGGWKFEVGYWTLEVEPVKPENLVAGKTKRIETEAQLGAGPRLHL